MKKNTPKDDLTTTELTRELLARLGDWFEDPERQHDEYFATVNQGSLEQAYRSLMNCTRTRKEI
jgi:hypothetical protein